MIKIWDLRSGLCVRHFSSMGLVSEGENEKVSRSDELPRTETIIEWAAVDQMQSRFLFTTCKGGIRVWDLDKLEHIGTMGANING